MTNFTFVLMVALLSTLQLTYGGSSSEETWQKEPTDSSWRVAARGIDDRDASHSPGNGLFSLLQNVNGRRRLGPSVQCDQIIENLDVYQAKELFNTIVDRTVHPNTQENFLMKLALRNHINYGLQIRKVCGSCAEFLSPSSNEAFREYCGSDVYGFDALQSGLLIIPLVYSYNSDGEIVGLKINPGTHKGFVYSHPSLPQSYSSVPSEQWDGDQYSFNVMVGFVAAASGSIAILPDYMGYGETAGDFYKSYAVKKAYQTATVPLWMKTSSLIALDTNCESALAGAAVLAGYSDGGYASVAVADALSFGLGVDIVSVQTGGAPFRMGSLMLPRLVESVDRRNLPVWQQYILAMLGCSYSTTYPQMANYGQGQNVLSSYFRPDIITMLQDGVDVNEVNVYVSSVAVEDNRLEIFDPNFVGWIRDAVANGNWDPCDTSVIGFNDKLCQALRENDLTESLHQATYPVRLCYSEDDPVVDIDNLPNFNSNRQRLSLIPTRGDHTKAGRYCLVQSLLFLTSLDFKNYETPTKHSVDGCQLDENGHVLASYMGQTLQETPSLPPSSLPSMRPSISSAPTKSPAPTLMPSAIPSLPPSISPQPSISPHPSAGPSLMPSAIPSLPPSISPQPSISPYPSAQPSSRPSSMPSVSQIPTTSPTSIPTQEPSATPSISPQPSISPYPSAEPSLRPSSVPSVSPIPTTTPTSIPTQEPSATPSMQPTISPAPSSSPTVSAQPSASPSSNPTEHPTSTPSSDPTEFLLASPSGEPSEGPSTTADSNRRSLLYETSAARPAWRVCPLYWVFYILMMLWALILTANQ